MSKHSVPDDATAEMVLAATLVATAHMTRFGPARRDRGETGERYVPLDRLDLLIVAPTPPQWSITLYLRDGQAGPGEQTIAIITNHDGDTMCEPHVAYQIIGLAQFHAVAAHELRLLVAGRIGQEGDIAA